MNQTSNHIFSLISKGTKSPAHHAMEHTSSKNQKISTNLSSRDTEATLSMNSDLRSSDEMQQECQSEDLEIGPKTLNAKGSNSRPDIEQVFWRNI